MKLQISGHGTLLLVVPLATELQTRLLQRAAFVARKKSLDVVVLTPALSTAPPHTELSANIETGAASESHKLAREHAKRAVHALRDLGIGARAVVDTGQSVMLSALDLIEDQQVVLVMVSADDYSEWSGQSLTDSGLLERCPVPIWVENDGRSDTLVLGALELRGPDSIAPMDDRVARETRDTANDLGSEPHIVHSLTPQDEVPPFVGSAVPGAVLDDTRQSIEDRHARLAHDVAKRNEIAQEHVHLERGELTTALTDAASALEAGVIVIGASRRSGLTRLLFAGTPDRLLDRLSADVLIVNRVENPWIRT